MIYDQVFPGENKMNQTDTFDTKASQTDFSILCRNQVYLFFMPKWD